MQQITRYLLIVIPILMFYGCDKVNQENFDKISSGQTYPETLEILGKPKSCDTLLSAKNCMWGDKDKTVNITFVNNKVVLFSASNL